MKVVSKRIEMIAYFRKDGKINPIRFRIEEENKCQVIKIIKNPVLFWENRIFLL
ncbi:hypothetical protein [Clostridium chromiireducens]|uniref:hypothetical protein n=1 Tax=Clostridium chromiireducens TaxID=225345 RepID=UPI001474717C|nr:hypothetical protein [Clostridium chromiireducens]